jgi:hypothetical protein
LVLLTMHEDVCYNLRFFEPHGRQLADPWSCRQSAIHQKFYPSRGNSAWIIIHQPMALRENLQHAQSRSFLHPMAMHIRYIRSANYHWRDYLNYRNSELLSLVSCCPLILLVMTYGLGREAINCEAVQRLPNRFCHHSKDSFYPEKATDIDIHFGWRFGYSGEFGCSRRPNRRDDGCHSGRLCCYAHRNGTDVN